MRKGQLLIAVFGSTLVIFIWYFLIAFAEPLLLETVVGPAGGMDIADWVSEFVASQVTALSAGWVFAMVWHLIALLSSGRRTDHRVWWFVLWLLSLAAAVILCAWLMPDTQHGVAWAYLLAFVNGFAPYWLATSWCTPGACKYGPMGALAVRSLVRFSWAPKPQTGAAQPVTNCYALSIGGSGARCVESLIYMCAAGLGPRGRLTLIFVDPDRSNFSLARTLAVAEWYRTLQAIPRGEGCPLFQTEIVLTRPKFWTPFQDGQDAPSLASFFASEAMGLQAPADAALFDILYTPQQQRANLSIGFRGRPSIGAAVFGAKINLDTEEPWHTVAERIGVESVASTVKVFAFGSLFGGTGAAGLPTIPRILCRRQNPQTGRYDVPNPNVLAGACLLLPYFTFSPAANVSRDEVYARSDGFLLNAKEALRYYATCNPEFRRLYVLGSEDLKLQDTFSIGGESQYNRPSFVEMLAALSARDFFLADIGREAPCQVGIVGRKSPSEFAWDDVPGNAEVHPLIGQLTRMAFAYVRLFYPYFEELWTTRRTFFASLAHRRAWYQDLVERRSVDLSDAATNQLLKDQRSFFVAYLEWLRDLHVGNQAGGFSVRLADASAFWEPADAAKLLEEKFGRLTEEQAPRADSLEDLLRRIAAAGMVAYPNAARLGVFQRAVHDACGYR